MNHPRISVPALVTFIVAVVTLGLLVAPARPAQSGRRPSARTSRTAPRLDAADPVVHDTDYHETASGAARSLVVARPTARPAAVVARRAPRLAQSDQAPAIPMSSPSLTRNNRTSPHRLGAAVHPPTRVAVAVSGRAPPA